MMTRMLVAVVGAGLWIALGADLAAGVAAHKPRRAHVVLEAEPPAPVADRPSALVRESLARQPIEPIPVGGFGPFGQSAGPDIAPVAPEAPPSWDLLDLRNDPDPEDASAPTAPPLDHRPR